MNKLTITLEIETYSPNPEEWIADLIVDALEEGESITSINCTRKENESNS